MTFLGEVTGNMLAIQPARSPEEVVIGWDRTSEDDRITVTSVGLTHSHHSEETEKRRRP